MKFLKKKVSYRAGCEGKVRFTTWKIAEKAAKRKKGRHPYRCNFCKGIHVGRSLK